MHCAIIGSTNIEHVKANLAAAEKGPLPPDAVQKLRAAFDGAETASGTIWIGQT